MRQMSGPKGASYLQQALKGERLVAEPMRSECVCAVVVPVMAEPIKRVLSLLESLVHQQEVQQDAFEVIVLVNRPTDNGSNDSRRAEAMNALVLGLPVWANRDSFDTVHRYGSDVVDRCRAIRDHVTAHVIDKSSPGEELADGNVGKARDRALAEGCLRFDRIGKDGLIIMTDADVRFTDAYHLAKALEVFRADPDMVAASGGVDFVLDPDEEEANVRAEIIRAFERILRFKRWSHMQDYLAGRKMRFVPQGAFFGNHILVRSSIASEVCGVPHRLQHEDTVFGMRCREYAASHHKRVGDVSRALRVSSALRESNRTWQSFSAEALRRRPVFVDEREYQALVRKLSSQPAGRLLLSALDDTGRALYEDVVIVSSPLVRSA